MRERVKEKGKGGKRKGGMEGRKEGKGQSAPC